MTSTSRAWMRGISSPPSGAKRKLSSAGYGLCGSVRPSSSSPFWSSPSGSRRARVARDSRRRRARRLTLVAVWLAGLPIRPRCAWWRRRYRHLRSDYSTNLVDPWLAGKIECCNNTVAIALVMPSRQLGDRWWLVGGPAFAALASAFILAQPLLLVPRLEPLQKTGSSRPRSGSWHARAESETLTWRCRTRAGGHVRSARSSTGSGRRARDRGWDTALDGRLQPRRDLTLKSRPGIRPREVQPRLEVGRLDLSLRDSRCLRRRQSDAARRAVWRTAPAVPLALHAPVLQLALLPVR